MVICVCHCAIGAVVKSRDQTVEKDVPKDRAEDPPEELPSFA